MTRPSVACATLVCMVLVSPAASLHAGSLTVNQLRCEYKSDPIGIDITEPRLSWQLAPQKSGQRTLKQTAYQILVSSSLEQLQRDQGNLWDSGQTESDQSVNVVYAGQPLSTLQDCFWKVRVWDQNGKVSDWSEPGRWVMGVLQDSDWHATWIGFDGGARTDDSQTGELNKLMGFAGNEWIWTAGAQAGNQPAGSAYFRRSFDLPADRTLARGLLVAAADDAAALYVNGNEVGRSSSWKTAANVDVTGQLRAGRNVLAISVTNGGTTPTPAGLLGKLILLFEEGSPLVIPIDTAWLSATTVDDQWQQVDFNDSNWTAASVIARHGDGPWGELQNKTEKVVPASYLRKQFAIDKPLKRAILYASALGLYEMHINGQRLDTDVLSPGWTDYSRRVHYLGYDVTKQLQSGENVLGAILGDGWYAGYLAFSGRRHYYGENTRLIARLQLDFTDGSSIVVGTDGSWQASYGPIREADLLMGCTYDARRELALWCSPQGDGSQWEPVVVDDKVQAHLQAHPGTPIRRMQELPARKVTQPQPGVYVFDLGQNMVGWVRLRARGPAGQKVVVRHAEMLNPDGTMYTTNLRAAKATDTYYLAGDTTRDYEPYFTFHGFQYVEVTGLDYQPELSDVTGIVVYSDLPGAGTFVCNDPLVNKLVENTVWGQKGNFLDVPTDCPQRDERAGWTGDAQVFMKTACLNLDSPAFFTKWLTDLCQDSQREDGGFGDVAPHVNVVGFGNTGWADAGVVCNWRMVEMYGDTRVVQQHYPTLLRYMDYLEKTSKDYIRGTGAYGDWLRLAGPQHSDAIGTAYYYYSTQLMVKLAQAIGRNDDAAKYARQAESIKQAFVRHFVKDDGSIVDEKGETGQTFYALAFALDLVPPQKHELAATQFVEEIQKQDWHLATGFLGTPMVLFALEKAGQTDLAYRLVLNRTYPSWLLQVELGSTTMWERWDGWLPDKGFQDPGMNSFNHYWLGCVGEWLLCSAAGIDTDGPGFARIIIHPKLASAGKGLTAARGEYDSIRGKIVSDWKQDAAGLSLSVTIPPNTTATVYVPAQDPSRVREGGKPARDAEGVKYLKSENGYAVFEVGSGEYAFTVK